MLTEAVGYIRRNKKETALNFAAGALVLGLAAVEVSNCTSEELSNETTEGTIEQKDLFDSREQGTIPLESGLEVELV